MKSENSPKDANVDQSQKPQEPSEAQKPAGNSGQQEDAVGVPAAAGLTRSPAEQEAETTRRRNRAQFLRLKNRTRRVK